LPNDLPLGLLLPLLSVVRRRTKSNLIEDFMATLTEAKPEAVLSNDEILRYSRHLIMPEVGMEGQQKLKAAKVLCIGAGGLGSPLALYLTAAGVGTLGIVDFDVVDYTNLQRQIIHTTADVGRKKLDSAADKLKAINPYINLRTFDTRLSSANALELFREFDIIADGTDNFPTRYLVNDACVLTGKPNVYGSIFRFEGQASVFATEEGPCYRCLYPEPPPPGLVPSCAEGGVLGILPGLVGVIQATETIKLILGQGDPLIGRLLLVDALAMKFRELKLRKSPDCPACGKNPTVKELIDYNEFCGIRGEEETPATTDVPAMTVEELKQQLDAKKDVFILDVREPHEYQICNLNGYLIPLGDLPKRVHELDSSREIVAHCRSGVRSGKAVTFLRQAGFKKVHNLTGGILAWADKIDPKMPKY
jgi:sulfur-carrier protein adenylyltransferase/sulfurtransferase